MAEFHLAASVSGSCIVPVGCLTIMVYGNTCTEQSHRSSYTFAFPSITNEVKMSAVKKAFCQTAALSVCCRGWWEMWGAVRNHVALVWSHSSSLFGLSCIRAPLLPRFTRGNTTELNAFPPSCCSVLSVFRWVFPANQEPTNSTFNKHWLTLTFIYLSVSLQRWLPWQHSWFRRI